MSLLAQDPPWKAQFAQKDQNLPWTTKCKDQFTEHEAPVNLLVRVDVKEYVRLAPITSAPGTVEGYPGVSIQSTMPRLAWSVAEASGSSGPGDEFAGPVKTFPFDNLRVTLPDVAAVWVGIQS